MWFGVAIEIPAPHGPHLRSMRASFGDPQASLIPAHVTLAPPTEIDFLDDVRIHLGRVAAAAAPFRMSLMGSGSFRPVSPVVYVALDEGVDQTAALASQVRSALRIDDLQFPFHPHVTVAHEIGDDALDRAERELADYEAHFEVTRFGLWINHATDGWQVEQEFDLLADV